MIYICCFFCIVYICNISAFAAARVYFLSLVDRGSEAKCRLLVISYIYKCYLTTPACLLVPSTRNLRFLSCMLRTISIKFLHIVFDYIFYIPKVFLKETLKNLFLQDVSSLLMLCLDSEEMCLAFT